MAYSNEELRYKFVHRTDDEMFAEAGSRELPRKTVAALEDEGRGHLLVWLGYEMLTGCLTATERRLK